MSQYPSPYLPPSSPYPQMGYYGGWDPREQLLAPARRAGLLMIVLGALSMLLGGCAFGISRIPASRMPPEVQEQWRQYERLAGRPLPEEAVRGAVQFGGAGIVFVVLGIFIRRGGKASIISGIVISSIVVLLMTIGALGAIGIGQPLAACVQFVFIAPFVLLLVWLIAAVRNAGQLAYMNPAYQAQYWQQMQQQQAYAQQGYPQAGYPQVNYPPPYVPQPPVPPPSQEPPQGSSGQS